MGRLRRMNSCSLLFASRLFLALISASHSLDSQYAKARRVRTVEGHEAALAMYQSLLSSNPHDRTAATRIAASARSPQRHDVVGRDGDATQRRRFAELLASLNYTSDGIANVIFSDNASRLETAKSSSAPLYLPPLRAGSLLPPLPTCGLTTCVQLLLMSVCLPVEMCLNFLGQELVDLLEILGIAFPEATDENGHDDNLLLVPYCHIMPVYLTNIHRTIYVATDLHPNVLSSITVGKSCDGIVMYIGPDSLGLVDHWIALQEPISCNDDHNSALPVKIVDVGTGSGIQALSLAATLNHLCQKPIVQAAATCVDINPRALRFTKLNFDMNDLAPLTLILGDIVKESEGKIIFPSCDRPCAPWKKLLGSAACILSNPPFLPVPVDDPIISKRYGFFSDGGSNGETFLRRLLELASTSLCNPGGTLAVVSEFMNPGSDFGCRLASYFGNGLPAPAKALLVTNEQALGAQEYARRRSDDMREVDRWIRHLESHGIHTISPGFLFVKRLDNEDSVLDFEHILLPRRANGSIWTPTNSEARRDTRSILARHFG